MNKAFERMRTAAGKRVMKQSLKYAPTKELYHGTHTECGKQLFTNGGYVLYSLTDYVQGLPEVTAKGVENLNSQKAVDQADASKTVEITLPKLEEVEAYIEQAKAGAKADGTTIRKSPERLGYYIPYEINGIKKRVLVNSEYLRDALTIVPNGTAYVTQTWSIYIVDNNNNQVYLCGCRYK